jgi:hypothetical protein
MKDGPAFQFTGTLVMDPSSGAEQGLDGMVPAAAARTGGYDGRGGPGGAGAESAAAAGAFGGRSDCL